MTAITAIIDIRYLLGKVLKHMIADISIIDIKINSAEKILNIFPRFLLIFFAIKSPFFILSFFYFLVYIVNVHPIITHNCVKLAFYETDNYCYNA